jgi:hypothetical protein
LVARSIASKLGFKSFKQRVPHVAKLRCHIPQTFHGCGGCRKLGLEKIPCSLPTRSGRIIEGIDQIPRMAI